MAATDLEEEEKKRFEELTKAVEFGEISAKTKLARFMLERRDVDERDEEGAVALLQECVDKDDPEAMWVLGLCYHYGIGTEQNLKRARELFKRSSKERSSVGSFLKKQNFAAKQFSLLFLLVKLFSVDSIFFSTVMFL